MRQPTNDRAPTLYVDDEPIEGPGANVMTAAEILAIAGRDADAVDLYAQGHHGQRLAPEEQVPVQDGSRFVTRPRDAE